MKAPHGRPGTYEHLMRMSKQALTNKQALELEKLGVSELRTSPGQLSTTPRGARSYFGKLLDEDPLII